MKEHEHITKHKPETKPAQDQLANKVNAEGTTPHAGSNHADHHNHQDHHAQMAADFRNRFWISLALTLPILLLSPLLQKLVGLRESIHFPGDLYVLFGFASSFGMVAGRS